MEPEKGISSFEHAEILTSVNDLLLSFGHFLDSKHTHNYPSTVAYTTNRYKVFERKVQNADINLYSIPLNQDANRVITMTCPYCEKKFNIIIYFKRIIYFSPDNINSNIDLKLFLINKLTNITGLIWLMILFLFIINVGYLIDPGSFDEVNEKISLLLITGLVTILLVGKILIKKLKRKRLFNLGFQKPVKMIFSTIKDNNIIPYCSDRVICTIISVDFQPYTNHEGHIIISHKYINKKGISSSSPTQDIQLEGVDNCTLLGIF